MLLASDGLRNLREHKKLECDQNGRFPGPFLPRYGDYDNLSRLCGQSYRSYSLPSSHKLISENDIIDSKEKIRLKLDQRRHESENRNRQKQRAVKQRSYDRAPERFNLAPV